MRLYGSKVVSALGVILHRGLDEDFAQLLFLRRVAHVITPQARLRLEVQLLGQRVVQVFFFTVHERGDPQAGLRVGAPAIEMEVPTGAPAAAISAVETHDMIILILYPDASQETALARFRVRSNVEHQAAHFTQEFAAHVLKFVVLLVEAVGIDENHLQETVRQILHRERKEISNAGKNLFALGVGIGQGNQVHALGKIRAAQKVFVARGYKSELLVGLQVLNVGFDQRRKLADFLVEVILIDDDSVNDLIHGPWLIGCGARRRCGGHAPHPARCEHQDSCC